MPQPDVTIINHSPALIILGDKLPMPQGRAAKPPGSSLTPQTATHLRPGEPVRLSDVPEARRPRTLKCLARALRKGQRVTVTDSNGKTLTAQDLES